MIREDDRGPDLTGAGMEVVPVSWIGNLCAAAVPDYAGLVDHHHARGMLLIFPFSMLRAFRFIRPGPF